MYYLFFLATTIMHQVALALTVGAAADVGPTAANIVISACEPGQSWWSGLQKRRFQKTIKRTIWYIASACSVSTY